MTLCTSLIRAEVVVLVLAIYLQTFDVILPVVGLV